MEENPGRQTLSGSFNPIDEGEWAEQVYIRPIQKLFHAIAAHDITLVRSLLEENKVTKTIDLQNRDHVGRTALHLAILVKDEEIAKFLIDQDCRMIARIVDGRTALHMAAQYGMDSLIEAMFEKSKANKEEAEKKEKESGKTTRDEDKEMKDGTTPPPTTAGAERPSSQDDWTSDENDGKLDDSMEVDDNEGDGEEDYDNCEDGDEGDEGDEGKDQQTKKDEKEEARPDGEVPEDGDEPDVLDVNVGDWDQGFTPLCYAILYGTCSTVDILLRHEADPNQAAVPSVTSWGSMNNPLPLFYTLVRAETNEDTAVSITERLIDAGASVSTADDNLMTVLHYAVFAQKARLLNTFLRRDPGAKAALDFPTVNYGSSKFPVVSAIAKGAYATLLTLLAYGTKVNPTGTDVSRAKAIRFAFSLLYDFRDADIMLYRKTDSRIWGWYDFQDYSKMIYGPVETAIARGDHIVDLLLEAGADVNLGTFAARGRYPRTEDKQTILDWVVDALEFHLPKKIKELKNKCGEIDEKIQKTTYMPPLEKLKTWKEYLDDFFAHYEVTSNKVSVKANEQERKSILSRLNELERMKEYLQHVRDSLELIGAKTWQDVCGSSDQDQLNQPKLLAVRAVAEELQDQPKRRYKFFSQNYRLECVEHDQFECYDELFEAAYRGDDAKIERLCVPSSEESDTNVVPVQITVEVMISNEPYTRTGEPSCMPTGEGALRLTLCRFDTIIRCNRRKEVGHSEAHHGHRRGTIRSRRRGKG
jgi:ankyrin repeat protein